MKLVERKKEELPDYYKYLSYEESKGLINEAQLGDIKLAICRNVGDGYTERKISWQDPVASRSRYIVLQHK